MVLTGDEDEGDGGNRRREEWERGWRKDESAFSGPVPNRLLDVSYYWLFFSNESNLL